MNIDGKKVLVTGAGGFIGSHLVEALLARGCEVRAFVHYNAFNSWGWLDTLPEAQRRNLDVFAGDIRDPHGVAQAAAGCEVVFHLAALIGIPYSYHSPDTYVDTNIKGTLNILQAARRHGTGRLIVTSTSEVYGTARYVPIDEAHPMQGQSPYSASKIGADRLAESFHKSFDLPVIIARPFNTYGPRQSARAVIPTVISQLLTGLIELKLGNLSPTRDFNFVRDMAAAFIALAEADAAVGQEVNIAGGREYAIGEVVDRLIAAINPAARVVTDEERLRPDASEVYRLLGDNRKLFELTSWRPSVDLDAGLAETIAWFRAADNLARYKAWRYNL